MRPLGAFTVFCYALSGAPALSAKIIGPVRALPSKEAAPASDDLLRQAEAGDQTAIISVARLYRDGGDLRQDRGEAARWYRLAIDQGNTTGMRELAEMWLNAADLGHSAAEAEALLNKAADQGNGAAMYDLGKLEERGALGTPHPALAHGWYLKAASQGHPGALAAIGRENLYGTPAAPPHPAEGIRLLQEAVVAGSSSALDDLGKAAMQGIGGPVDSEAAATYFHRALDAGYLPAWVDLGDAARDGKNGDADPQLAAKDYREAIRFGIPEGNLHLGQLYLGGKIEPQSAKLAARLFTEAAQGGVIAAYTALGDLYREGGNDLKPNHDLAIECYQFAAEKGDLTALTYLAEASPGGDPASIALLKEAANNGSLQAMQDLATLYREGKDVAADESAAEYWNQRAAEKRMADHHREAE